MGLQIAQGEDDEDVDDSERGEGIAKGAMDDVPEQEDLFGAGEEQDAFGE